MAQVTQEWIIERGNEIPSGVLYDGQYYISLIEYFLGPVEPPIPVAKIDFMTEQGFDIPNK